MAARDRKTYRGSKRQRYRDRQNLERQTEIDRYQQIWTEMANMDIDMDRDSELQREYKNLYHKVLYKEQMCRQK